MWSVAVNRFKLERTSSSGNSHCGPSPGSQNLAALAAANAAKARNSNPSGTAAAAHEQYEQQQGATQLSGGGSAGEAAAHGGSGVGGVCADAAAGQQGRWREGKMGTELKRMQDRLANLQSMYRQQLQGRQKSSGVPAAGEAAAATEGTNGMSGADLEPGLGTSNEAEGPALSAVAEECYSKGYATGMEEQKGEPEHTPDSKGPRQAAAAATIEGGVVDVVAGTQAAEAPTAAAVQEAPASVGGIMAAEAAAAVQVGAVAAPAATAPAQPAGTPPGVASKRAAVVARVSAVAIGLGLPSLSRSSSVTATSAVASREGDEPISTPAAGQGKTCAGGKAERPSTSGSSASPPQLATPLPLVLEQPAVTSSKQASQAVDAEASTAQPGTPVGTAAEAGPATATGSKGGGDGPVPAAEDPLPAAASQAVAAPSTAAAETSPAPSASVEFYQSACGSDSSTYTPASKASGVEGVVESKIHEEAGPAAESQMLTPGAASEAAALTPMAAVATPETVGAIPAAAVLQALEVGMIEYNNPCYDMTPGSALPVGSIPFSSLVSQVSPKHSCMHRAYGSGGRSSLHLRFIHRNWMKPAGSGGKGGCSPS